jgi:hypothetical protein
MLGKAVVYSSTRDMTPLAGPSLFCADPAAGGTIADGLTIK